MLKRFGICAAVLLFAVACIGLLTGGAYGDMIGSKPDNPAWVEYENNKLQNDGINNNDYNFGKSLKFDDGKAETALNDLFARMDGSDDGKADPVLGCAIAQAVDLSHGTKFLDKWSNKLIGERANAAVDYFVNDNGGHKDEYLQMIASVEDEIKKGSLSVMELNSYESQMYQINGAFDNGTRPALTVKKTNNDSGNAIVIKWDDGTELKLRIQCGGQPVDVPEWNPPGNPPPPDTTTPPPTTEPPEETQPPTETTTLAPKVPGEAPVVNNNPDIGGKVDTEHIHTEETPRETAPSTYIPPDPPKATTQAATQPQTTQPAQTEPQREVVTGAPYSVPFEEVAPPTKPEEIATDAPHGALSDEQEKAADDKFG